MRTSWRRRAPAPGRERSCVGRRSSSGYSGVAWVGVVQVRIVNQVRPNGANKIEGAGDDRGPRPGEGRVKSDDRVGDRGHGADAGDAAPALREIGGRHRSWR